MFDFRIFLVQSLKNFRLWFIFDLGNIVLEAGTYPRIILYRFAGLACCTTMQRMRESASVINPSYRHNLIFQTFMIYFEHNLNNEIWSHLDSIFDNYEQTRFDSSQRLLDEQARKKEFLHNFDIVVCDVIAPTMKEIGAYLQTKGHDYTIGNSFEEKACFLNIFPYKKHDYSHPSISFLAIESTQEITIHTKAFMPGEEGTENYLGEFTIDKITKDFVEKQIIDLIKECFSSYREVSASSLLQWR